MAGLRKNDVVYNINGCATKSTADWYKCLAEIKGTKVGFCVPNEKILPGLAKKVIVFMLFSDSIVFCVVLLYDALDGVLVTFLVVC